MICTPNKRIARLEGLCVTRLSFDARLMLLMSDLRRSLTLIIGTPFALGEDDSARWFDPEQTTTMEPVLTLLHRPVAFFEATRQGDGRLRFEEGMAIRVPKHREFESWEACGSGELEDVQMLCSPHGGPPWLED